MTDATIAYLGGETLREELVTLLASAKKATTSR